MNTPLYLADPHKDAIPHTYVVQVDSFNCLNCRASHSSCEVFARTWLRGQWGKPYSNLRPMKGDIPRYNLPIEVIHRQPNTVPFCHECPSPMDVVKNLPYPPPETKTTIGAGFTKTEDPKKPPTKTSKKPITTTDDLLKDLDL